MYLLIFCVLCYYLQAMINAKSEIEGYYDQREEKPMVIVAMWLSGFFAFSMRSCTQII